MKKLLSAMMGLILLLPLNASSAPWYWPSGGGASSVVAIDPIFTAAGDLIYGTGSGTSDNLAIGASYQLLMVNSGATAPAWTYTIGATGTRMTKIWTTDIESTNMPTVNGTAIDSTFMPIGWISRAGANNVLTYTGNYSLGLTLSNNTAVTLPTSGTLATTAFKPSDLSITDQAAGDVLYFNGTNWVRLAADAGKYLKSGASAVSWDTPVGGTVDISGTPANHYWTSWTDDNTVKGTAITSSKPVCSDASGDPAVCAGTEGVWQTAITFGTGTETALASAPDASGGLLSVGGLGSVTQAYSDILSGIAGVTPANNGIFGYNNSGELGLYTNHSHDDSAAHYFNATDATKLFQYDLQYMTTGKKITYQPTAADNYSYKVTITGNTDVTMPTSGTILSSGVATGGLIFGDDSPDSAGEIGYDGALKYYDAVGLKTVATVKTEKIASFAWDGGGSAVATANSKRCVLIPVAYTVTGYNMVVDQDPGAGTTILNLDKDAIGDGTALATTDMDGTSHAYPPTVPDNKVAVNDSTITGWTTAVSANDMICATVATNAVATWISLSIYGTK